MFGVCLPRTGTQVCRNVKTMKLQPCSSSTQHHTEPVVCERVDAKGGEGGEGAGGGGCGEGGASLQKTEEEAGRQEVEEEAGSHEVEKNAVVAAP